MTARQRRRSRRGRQRPRSESGEQGAQKSRGSSKEGTAQGGGGGQARSGGEEGGRKTQGKGTGEGRRGRRPQGKSAGEGRRGRKPQAKGKGAKGKGGGEGQRGRKPQRRTAGESGRGRRPQGRSGAPAGRPRKSAPTAERAGLSGLEIPAALPMEATPTRKKPPVVRELESIEVIGRTLESVLEASPADETELVWLEVSRGEANRRGNRIDVRTGAERTILVRVLDLGRVGSYRTCSGTVGDLSNAVRLAISQSRVREPLTGLPHLPADAHPTSGNGELHDRSIGELTPQRARELLKALPAEGETLRMEWADSRVVVYNSRKIRRQAAVTGVGFEASCGHQPGAGRAADAARRLDALNPEAILERARKRHAGGDVAELPEPGVPVLLAPEATISLIQMLNQESFSAKAYYDGTSFLREHLGIQVFDRALTLRDDGTDPSGIPFPFDLEGTAKRDVPLILEGAPKTPALDQRQAAVLGLPATAHAIGGNDARAQNVFLVGGDKSADELLQVANGGIWIGWLDHLECREPNRVQFRTRARGARLIEDGRLGRPLPDLFWEDSLLRAFSSILGIGNETARRLTRDGYLGGFSAPAIALGGVEGLSVSVR